MRLAADRWKTAIRPEGAGRIASLCLLGAQLLDQGIGIDQPTAGVVAPDFRSLN